MTDNNYLGIPEDRKKDIQDFIELSADLDFWHDFHHGTNAKMDARFFKEFATTYQLTPTSTAADREDFTDKVRKLQKMVIEMQGKQEKTSPSFWEFFSKKAPIVTTLPPPNFFGRMGNDEDRIIDDFLWVKHPKGRSSSLSALKRTLDQTFNKVGAVPTLYANDKVKIRVGPKITKSLGTLASNNQTTPLNDYDITAFPNRYRASNVSPIVPLLEISEPGTQNFILLIDVTLLKISYIKTRFSVMMGNQYNSTNTYNIYIISSLENESDPAGKIGTIETGSLSNINVYFLQEAEPSYNAVFPNWTKGSGKNSFFYSKCKLRTYRTPTGKIGCQVTLPSNKTVDHQDLGVISEIRAASYAMTRKFIEFNLIPNEAQQSEISHYYLLKRAADWCQALCLLDRDRAYKVLNSDFTQSSQPNTSINQFVKANPKTEVALMTHDRVLLSYALQLGLNVMFSVLFTSKPQEQAKEDDEEKSDKTIVQVYFKNQKSNEPEFQYVLLLTQVNSILKRLDLDTYEIPQASKDTAEHIKHLQGMILDGAKNIDIDKINSEIAASTKASAEIKKMLDFNKVFFNIDLAKYLARLRLLLFIESHVEKDIAPITKIAEQQKQDIYVYISSISTALDKLENNKGLIALLETGKIDNLLLQPNNPQFQLPANFANEIKCINDVVALIEKRANFMSSWAGSGIQREWINFEGTVLKQIEYDAKLCQIKKEDVLSDLKMTAKYKGLSMFYNKLVEVFPKAEVSGKGSEDDAFVNILLSRKINTLPLNILEIPKGGTHVDKYIRNTYKGYPKLESIINFAKAVYKKKSVTMSEPQLTDYCNDIIDSLDTTKDLPSADDAIAAFDKEGLYTTINKTYIPRGSKLVDINNHYNTVVDDYVIDTSNGEEGFKYFIDKESQLNDTNKKILKYRFIIYYLDRLYEKLQTYKDYIWSEEQIAFEQPAYQRLIKELYHIDLHLNRDIDVSPLLNNYYNPYSTISGPPVPQHGEKANRFYSILIDEDIDATIIGLERDVKRALITAIFKYYSVISLTNPNSQILESLFYNLCLTNRDVIDIFTTIVDDHLERKQEKLDALFVVYIIINAYNEDNKDNPVEELVKLSKTSLPSGSAVVPIASSCEKCHIYYARAIRFAANKDWASSRLGPLITQSAKYINSSTPMPQDAADQKNIIATLMYLNKNKEKKSIDYLLSQMKILQITALVPFFIETLGAFIKICNITEPVEAKENGYYVKVEKPIIIAAAAAAPPSVTLPVADFNSMMNRLLEDMRVEIRANFVDTTTKGGSRKNRRETKNKTLKNAH